MAILKIVTSDQSRLREPSSEMTALSDLNNLVTNMQETMEHLRGVGIAAPQVGVNQRIAIITQAGDEAEEQRTPSDERESIVIINPIFLSKSDETIEDDEGCLSIPGVYGPVSRSTEVEIEYQDLEGNKHRLKASGFDARVIQHEIDHLDGKLFVDRMDDISATHR